MEIQFIGQGYNTEIGSSVAQVLIDCLSDESFHTFKCLVAFASVSGVRGLLNHINNSKKHISTYKIVVGVDQYGTSKEALEALLEYDLDCYVFYTTSPFIFHPKIYFFESDTQASVILGSNNLTKKGLTQNIEGAIHIKYSKDEGYDLLEQIKNYYLPIFDNNDENLYFLNTDLIENLVSEGIVKNEIEVRRMYNNKSINLNSIATNVTNKFVSRTMQRAPVDFNSANIRVQSTVPQATIKNISNAVEWTINQDNDVLIAQVGGPGRWKQVNFPISMFVNYFGATAGDNSYNIRIRHIENHRILDEIETRQAVTVASQNYRFEIGAASGLTYPSSDRPIVVFIKVGSNDFIYKLVMPTNNNYNEISKYLNDNYNGPGRNLQRIIKSLDDIKENCASLYGLISYYIQ